MRAAAASFLVSLVFAVQPSSGNAQEQRPGPGAPASTAAATSHDALVDRLFESARLQQAAQSMARNLLAEVLTNPDLDVLAVEQRQALIDEYRRNATPERFAASLRAVLTRASAAELLALDAMHNSPIARSALEQELAFAMPSEALLITHANHLASSPDGAMRVAAVERLDAAIELSETALTVAAANLYGTTLALQELASAGTAGLQDAPELDESSLGERIEALIDELRPHHRQRTHLSYLYAYRNLSTRDLDAYVGMQESEPVRSVQRRLTQAVGAELVAIQRDVVQGMVETLSGPGDRRI